MIETAVLAIFLAAMVSLAAGLCLLSLQSPGSVSDARGSAAGKGG
jgi:hypothetical protein